MAKKNVKYKARLKNISDCTKVFEIEIPADSVGKTLSEVYEEIRKAAKIPGYRQGTAPRDLLEKHHSEDAREEALKRLIPEGYESALDEHGVSPITYPEITDVEFGLGKPLSFKAKVDVRPAIKLINYKDIRVKRNIVEVGENEIQTALERIQAINAKYENIDARPVQKGDYVVCDIEAFCEGKPISKKSENMWVVAEKEASLLGLGEQLIGLGRLETKDIAIKVPDDYRDKNLKGKDALFKVSVKEIKIRRLPLIDDELAKDMGKENLQALREEIIKGLRTKKEETETVNQENQILDALLKGARFSVPQAMVERQHKILMKRFEEELLSKGVNKEAAEDRKKEFTDKLKKDAENKVRIYFLLNEIAEKENIKVSEADLDERLDGIAKAANQPKEKVKGYYAEHGWMDGLAEQVREEKTLRFLLK